MHAAFAADAGLLGAAEGGAQVTQEPAVDPGDADLDRRGDAMRAREVLSGIGGMFKDSRINFTALNVTDEDPPFVDGGTAANDVLADPYDPANATAIGRTLALSFDKRW